MNKSKIIDIVKNLCFSFLAYAMPTAVLQFIIQPILANRLGSELNGQYLTLMSLNYLIIGVTATVLNTTRMLQDAEYKKRGFVGDFNIFFIIYAAIIIVVIPLGQYFYTKIFNPIEMLLCVVIALLYLYHDYIFAQYRLRMQFNKILINNILLVVGYFVGLWLFFLCGKWQVVIITAYAIGAVFDFINTDFLREPIRITPMLSDTFRKILPLMISSLIASSITYCDKLLLFPLLGGTSVSIYNSASVVGKMLILVSSPLNSVFLSYMIQTDTLNIKIKKKQILLLLAFLGFAYFACVVVGFPLTDLLYPDWAAESQKYIPITVATSLFTLTGSVINTVVIRFYKTSFQITIQCINLFVYLICALSLWYFFSLMGFCVGIMIAGLLKMIFLISILLLKKPNINNFKEKES